MSDFPKETLYGIPYGIPEKELTNEIIRKTVDPWKKDMLRGLAEIAAGTLLIVLLFLIPNEFFRSDSLISGIVERVFIYTGVPLIVWGLLRFIMPLFGLNMKLFSAAGSSKRLKERVLDSPWNEYPGMKRDLKLFRNGYWRVVEETWGFNVVSDYPCGDKIQYPQVVYGAFSKAEYSRYSDDGEKAAIKAAGKAKPLTERKLIKAWNRNRMSKQKRRIVNIIGAVCGLIILIAGLFSVYCGILVDRGEKYFLGGSLGDDASDFFIIGGIFCGFVLLIMICIPFSIIYEKKKYGSLRPVSDTPLVLLSDDRAYVLAYESCEKGLQLLNIYPKAKYSLAPGSSFKKIKVE